MLGHELERKICIQLNNLPETIDACAKSYKPHTLARYALDLAQIFNEYYANQKIINENEEITAARIALIMAVRQTLENSLRLLGIDAPKQM
jgi:arginyl-tRNA synthetase